ncbi:unnamed protein product [Pleuronectes platessa]|uniref:Uncharacterized protein n=1 Tax=Pleuronectes platessa TaxID=8262 RepID=A0A9N7U6D7_PLEPL|nr:unnamed protein product [Pleuronectes platessa]
MRGTGMRVAVELAEDRSSSRHAAHTGAHTSSVTGKFTPSDPQLVEGEAVTCARVTSLCAELFRTRGTSGATHNCRIQQLLGLTERRSPEHCHTLSRCLSLDACEDLAQVGPARLGWTCCWRKAATPVDVDETRAGESEEREEEEREEEQQMKV